MTHTKKPASPRRLLAAAGFWPSDNPRAGAARPPTQDVLVFAAASLKNALDDVDAAYGKETGQQGRPSPTPRARRWPSRSSGRAGRHLHLGRPRLDGLSGRAQPDRRRDTRKNLLGNELVLVAPKDSALDHVDDRPGLRPRQARSATAGWRSADVKSVPAGKYAKAALEKLGVWGGVEGKVAQAENVRAALALVARGEAPLGIVYETDAAADPRVKIVGTFPADSHPPIIYPVAADRARRTPRRRGVPRLPARRHGQDRCSRSRASRPDRAGLVLIPGTCRASRRTS